MTSALSKLLVGRVKAMCGTVAKFKPSKSAEVEVLTEPLRPEATPTATKQAAPPVSEGSGTASAAAPSPDGGSQKGRKRTIKPVKRFAKTYELGEELHPSCHAGMEVRHARSKVTGEEVVVKVRWKQESFANVHEEQEWRANTELLLQMPSNSSIARVLEVLEEEHAYYVVMERCKGMDLSETLRNGQTLPAGEVKDVLRHLLWGLVNLHERGFIHKDLKLENVMVDRAAPASAASSRIFSDGQGSREKGPVRAGVRVKIIDFDTVEVVGSNAGGPKPGVIQGTDQYLAPEAYSGHYSRASDVFAVGVMAYAMLAGRFPFSDELFDFERAECFAGSPKMVGVQEKLARTEVDWSHPEFARNPLARDLVKRMIAMDRCARPSARSALSHTWLSSSAAPCQLPGHVGYGGGVPA